MGKKKSDDATAVALFVLGLMCIIFAVVVPVIFLYIYFQSKSGVYRLRGMLTGDSTFWLDDFEKNQFINLNNEVQKQKEIIAAAHLYAIKNNVSKNKDGRYSARSNAGKKVLSVLSSAEPIYQESQIQLNLLSLEPKNNWDKLNQCLKKQNAAVWGILFWIIVFIWLVFPINKQIIDFSSAMGVLLVPAFLSSLSAVLFAGLVYLVSRGAKKVPKPPVVTMENLNTY